MPQILKKVSSDEAQTKYREVSKRRGFGADVDTSSVTKAAKAPASWNKEKRSARFIMTTEQVDRYGDIVSTKGADVTEFLRNPVGLLFHNSRTWPVAKWDNVESKLAGRPPRMEGDFVMLPEGGPVKEVDECAWMIANDGIRACSIGFIPDWDDVEMILDEENEWITGWKFNAWELTECSVCAVPANAGALVKSANGDMNLARELLEDVLDNWIKTPEGLILSRSDFEAVHAKLEEARKGGKTTGKLKSADGTFEVDLEKGIITMSEPAPETNVPPADPATTTDKTIPTPPETTTAPPEKTKDATVPADVELILKDVKADDAVTVEKGMSFVGIENGFAKWAKSSGAVVRLIGEDGIARFHNLDALPEDFDATIQAKQAELQKKPADQVQLSVSVDTSAAEAAIEKVDGLLTRLFAKFPSFLKAKEPEQHIEPVIVPPAQRASAEDIAAAQAAVAATRTRLAAKGLISA